VADQVAATTGVASTAPATATLPSLEHSVSLVDGSDRPKFNANAPGIQRLEEVCSCIVRLMRLVIS